MSPEPGTVFAGHRIDEELGRGGMGVVYRAHELTLDRPRALKVIAENLATEAPFAERFRREARLAASVDHPNVVSVHQAGEEDGVPYLSMSMVEGPDLGSLVASTGPLEGQRAAHLISQVAAGLEAAHAVGLVHRDIKPSNVVVDERRGEENAVITDFGLARLTDEDSGLTVSGDFMGSVDFAAPEQIEGGATDARTDVYSLGALAYFLLTGSPPFGARSSAAKLVAHVNAERPRPSEAGALVSPDADAAVMRAMAVDPAERFPTPGRFAEILVPALAAPVGISVRQERPSWAIGALIVALAAGAVAFLLALGGETRPTRSETPAPAPEQSRVEATIRVGDAPTALVSRAGATRVAAREAGEVGSIPFGDDEADPSRTIALPGSGEPISVAVGFGALWIVDSEGARLLRVPLDGNGEISDIPLEDPKDVTVSPGSVWVAQEEADSVAQIDPETNQVAEILPVSDGPRAVSFGDGGVWVACIEAGTVLRIDAAEARVEGKPIAAGTRPNDVAVGDDGIWVIDNLEGVVRRIDPGALVADDPIEVGARPRGVVAARGSIWVANSEDGTVTRVDESRTHRMEQSIEVGAEPADISAGGGSIWTANFADDTVSRINPG